MISFELKTAGKEDDSAELEIYLDEAGLESLLAQLQFLKTKQTEHVHMMSESWGGAHLENQPVTETNQPIHHVKILFR